MQQISKEWYAKNKDKRRAQYKATYADRREKFLLNNAKWRKNNPEKYRIAIDKWRLRNKDRVNANAREWARRNRNKLRAKEVLRYAIKMQAVLATVTLSELRVVYMNCPTGYHVDHIVPLRGENVCGLHVPWNLQYLPARENLRKSNKFEN